MFIFAGLDRTNGRGHYTDDIIKTKIVIGKAELSFGGSGSPPPENFRKLDPKSAF